MSTALAYSPTLEQTCFHCGEPVAANCHYLVEFDGSLYASCCAGCQAVAQTIIGQGMGAYYRQREKAAGKVEPLPASIREQIALYDDPVLHEHYVSQRGDVCETTLLLEGVRCSACVWLIQQTLRQQPGIRSVSVNYASQRAQIAWNVGQTELSDLLAAVRNIGYSAQPFDSGRQEALYRRERLTGLMRMLVAGLSMMQVMMYAWPAYFASRLALPIDEDTLLRWACLVVTLPAATYCAWPFYQGAWRDLRARRVGMDVPVALGIIGAFLPSVVATLTCHGAVYFDSVSMFVFLLLLGRQLELAARRRSTEGIDRLSTLLPRFAHQLPDWPQATTREVPVVRLAVGDYVLVKPGETVPADGAVTAGEIEVSEALLTGESRPVTKRAGDEVIGGSVNGDQPLMMRVTQIGQATRVAGMVRLIDKALSEKPQLVETTERYAQGFVLCVLLLASLSGAWWWWHDATKALPVVVAVLVITCPCALALATPAALTAATGALARRGLLIARGHALPTLARVTHVMFDKTGTLTRGEPHVEQVQMLADSAQVALVVRALETRSEHPLAQALLRYVTPGPVATVIGGRHVRGGGLTGSIDGVGYHLGKAAFVAQLVGLPCPDENRLWLGRAGQWMAGFEIVDAPRDDAHDSIARLRAAGIKTLIASGDHVTTVQALAATLGVDEARADMAPEDKLAWLQALQAQGAVVLMVGDGVNDAPVLAGAALSAAMGQGADIARQSADMVLLGEHLSPLADAYQTAIKTRRIIRQNLTWALVYNLVAVPPAMAGLVTPLFAGAGMALSSLLVVLNALRLARIRVTSSS